MLPLQAGVQVLTVLFWMLVPLAILVIVIYRLAQIAENTGRIADALEAPAAKGESTTEADGDDSASE